MQTVLETEIGEHEALKSAAHDACDALAVEGVQSGSSLGSRLTALSGQVREWLRGVLHTGVKRALAPRWQRCLKPSAMATSCLMMTTRPTRW